MVITFFCPQFGWYANPLVYGDYPEVMKEHILRHAKAMGMPRSPLPAFTPQTSTLVKGTLDFLGVNLYTANVAKAVNYKLNSTFWADCWEAETYQPASWQNTSIIWFKVSRIIKKCDQL